MPRATLPQKKSPLFWIAVGVATMIGIVVIFLGITILMARHTLGPDIFKKDGGGAIRKQQIRNDPDLEILSEGPDGSIVFRSKSTGKRQRLHFDNQRKRMITEDLPDEDTPAPAHKDAEKDKQ